MFGGAGKRSPSVRGLLLAVAIAALTASCTAAPRQVADLAQAKANCAAAERALGAGTWGPGWLDSGDHCRTSLGNLSHRYPDA